MNDKLLNSEQIIHRMRDAIGARNDGAVGEFVGASKQAVYNWKNRGSIPIEYCVKFCVKTGKSLDWLIFGSESGLSVGEAAARYGVELDEDYREIPVYDIEASAGAGSLFDQELVSTFLKFRKDWLTREGLHVHNLVAIRVSGDSMDGTLADGDTVLIDRSKRKPDGVFAIRIGDTLRIKRLQMMTDGSIRLSSDNPVYQPEVIHPENLSHVEIVGQCYWRGGRVF
ncbi:LexA family transcriptional regulator [Marinobacter alkaliphilus]|uniref:LexA family transcriptional regulator n=1 Tax=Marinobacter alkaliphilus TaxID=254719 RepID=A0ABZ3E7W9_9GAMM